MLHTEEWKNKRGKKVLQINSKSLKVIKTFPTLQKAAESVKVKRSAISWCCHKRVSQIQGYIWRFEGDNLSKLRPWIKYENIKRNKVYQFHSITLKLIKVWLSAREAARYYKINENNLSTSCRLKNGYNYGGFKWSYTKKAYKNHNEKQ